MRSSKRSRRSCRYGRRVTRWHAKGFIIPTWCKGVRAMSAGTGVCTLSQRILTLGLMLLASTADANEVAIADSACRRNCCLPTDRCCCADTYCPKPLPCVTCQPLCCPDCYCPKPLPSVCCQPLCCPDNYCCKPFPSICYGPVANCICGPSDRGHCPPPCKSHTSGASAAPQTAATLVERKSGLREAEKQSPVQPVAAAKRVMRMTAR